MSLPRLFAGIHADRPLSLSEHGAVHGSALTAGRGLIEEARLAGLRGRGGALFPTAVKLRSVAVQRGSSMVLVNGAEGEPMSAKDRVLLAVAPHLVLDGALAAADAIDARRVTIALPEDAAAARNAVRRAVDERSIGRRVRLATVPVAHLAGEETALISYLNGRPLKPTVVPPRPFEHGLRGHPTLVQNPETLAHLGLIGRHGAEWFRQVGTDAHPGSALVTVSGAVGCPGVQEIALGAPLTTVISSAGGATEELRAVLVGGYHGTWIDARQVSSVTLDDTGLRWLGGTLGAGIIVALGASACPVQELAGTIGWLASQSAHQCGPCQDGLPALAALLASICDGRADRDAFERLERWSAQIAGRGACRLPDGAVRFLASGLTVFAEEVERHHARGPCPACHRPTTLVTTSTGRRAA